MLGPGVYLLHGPGMLRIDRGSGEVLGYRLDEDNSIVVPVGRSVLARIHEGSIATYTGRWEKTDPASYESLDELAEKLAGHGPTILIGPSDTGKSTLASWITNKLSAENTSPLYATIDIGQNENYCPGFTSSTVAEGPFIPGSGGRLYKACFVGAFTPREALHRYVGCASRIVRGWRGSLVVDTDGWITPWEGLESKIAVIEAIGIEYVIAIGLKDKFVDFLRKKLEGARIVSIPPPYRGSKSREERRIHRERLIAKSLANAKERGFNINEIPVYGGPLFVGETLDAKTLSETVGSTVYYAEKVGGEIRIVARGRIRSVPGLSVIRAGWERGLLASAWYNGLGYPGLVTRMNYRNKMLYVLTPLGEKPDYIELGRVRLDPSSFMGKAKW